MEQQGASQRYCRKCLLRELQTKEYLSVRDYVARLPLEDKVSDEIYEKRLSVCRECDYLVQGTCQMCGCYVEMRAAMRVRKCAAFPAKWQAEPLDDDEMN